MLRVLFKTPNSFSFFYCRSSDDQEVLFDQILMGQLEFPLPYWDNVSETAKVNIYVQFLFVWEQIQMFGDKKTKPIFYFFAAEGADSIDAGGGGGSEIHCPPGAGASMGHCEYSVSSALTMMIRLD